MGIAQKLYQNGHITYMRTDSPGLSPEAIEMARTLIDQTYGQAYLPDKPRHYAAKSDGAQEAHEAIRPTNASVEGKDLKGVSEEDRKVYDLIRRRFLASQMTDARWGLLNVRLVRSDQATGAVLRAAGRTLEFDGYLKVSGVSVNADDQTLPELPEGTATYPFCVRPEQKFSSPPAATPKPRWSSGWKRKGSDDPQPTRPSSRSSRIATTSNWLARASTQRTLGKRSPMS